MNGGLSKIRSLHAYVMHMMFYFEQNCSFLYFKVLWVVIIFVDEMIEKCHVVSSIFGRQIEKHATSNY